MKCKCKCCNHINGTNIDFGGLGFVLVILIIVAGMAIHDWSLAGYPGC